MSQCIQRPGEIADGVRRRDRRSLEARRQEPELIFRSDSNVSHFPQSLSRDREEAVPHDARTTPDLPAPKGNSSICVTLDLYGNLFPGANPVYSRALTRSLPHPDPMELTRQ